MDQVKNSMTLDILQAMAAQVQLPKAGGKAGGDSGFQKLMDKAAGGKDTKPEKAPKDEKSAEGKTEKAPGQEKDSAQEESPIETSKKAAQFVVLGQIPRELMGDPVTLQVPGTEEEITILTGGSWNGQVWAREVTPEEIAGSPDAMDEGIRVIDVSDSEADAMLEATDPTVDHGPAALLEKVTAEQFGKVIDSAVKAVRPEDAEQNDADSLLVEITDAQQAPQPVFHDVKAAPVKVGEVEHAPETQETNVAQQVDAGVAQALEKGESMVRIQLSPENLGSVTVEISRSAEGIIRVALNAHSGETRSLLERHAGELQGLLSSRAQQSVEVSVQRQQESQQNQNHNYDGHNGHAQDGEQRHQRRQKQDDSVDFIHQLRLGLIPADGDE